MIDFVINPSSDRKKFFKRIISLLLCVILINPLSGCFESEAAAEIKRPDFEVTENRVSLEEFIVCYNAFYQKI